MDRNLRKSAVAFIIVGGLLLLVWFYKVILMPRPFWVTVAGDGELVYFFNSLAIIEGHRPPSVFHPGTPIQALGAVIAAYLRADPESIQAFLFYGYVVGILITLGTVGSLAFLMLPNIPILLGAAILLSFFLHPSALLYLTQWGTYMFHFPFGFLALWGLWESLKTDSRLEPIRVVFAGFFVGIASALQLLFLTLIPAGLIALGVRVLTIERPNREQVLPQMAVTRVISTVWLLVSTASIVLLIKLWSLGHLYTRPWPLIAFVGANIVFACFDLGYFWSRGTQGPNRLVSLVRVSYKYIGGALAGWLVAVFPVLDRLWARYAAGMLYENKIALLSFETVARNLNNLVIRSPGWVALVLFTWLVTILLLIQLVARPREAGGRSSDLSMGSLILTSMFFGLLLAAQEGNFEAGYQAGVALRYLLPVSVTTAFALAWLAQFYRLILSPALRRCMWLGGVVVLVAFVFQAMADLRLHRVSIMAGYLENRVVDLRLSEVSAKLGRTPISLMSGLHRPSWALRWGNVNADHLFDVVLDRRYPNEFAFDLRSKDPVVPRHGGHADLVFVREREFLAFSSVLSRFGGVDRLPVGFPDPIIMISVAPNPRDSR